MDGVGQMLCIERFFVEGLRQIGRDINGKLKCLIADLALEFPGSPSFQFIGLPVTDEPYRQ